MASQTPSDPSRRLDHANTRFMGQSYGHLPPHIAYDTQGDHFAIAPKTASPTSPAIISVWSVADRALKHDLYLPDLRAAVLSLAFHNGLIACGYEDGNVAIWDARTRACRCRTRLQGLKPTALEFWRWKAGAHVTAVDLAVGVPGHGVQIWRFDLTRNQIQVLCPLAHPQGPGKNPELIRFSPDGEWVAAACTDDDAVCVWDVGGLRRKIKAPTFGKPHRIPTERGFQTMEMNFKSNSKSIDIIWRTGTPEETWQRKYFHSNAGLWKEEWVHSNSKQEVAGYRAAIGRHWNWIATVPDYDLRGVQILHCDGILALPLRVGGHKATILYVAFSPDECWVVTGSADGAVLLWNCRAQRCFATLIEACRDKPGVPVMTFSFAPDSRSMVVFRDSQVYLCSFPPSPDQ